MAKSRAEMMKDLRKGRKADGLKSVRFYVPHDRVQLVKKMGEIFSTPEITEEQLKAGRALLRSLRDASS